MTPRSREDRVLRDLLLALDRTAPGAREPVHPDRPWIIDGVEVTAVEQNEAVRRGMSGGGGLGLLEAVDMRTGYLFATRLLAPGRKCVRRYDGDVAEWEAAHRAGTYLDQRVEVHQGDHGSVAAHSDGVDQRRSSEP